jgi:hypothetical protein
MLCLSNQASPNLMLQGKSGKMNAWIFVQICPNLNWKFIHLVTCVVVMFAKSITSGVV